MYSKSHFFNLKNLPGAQHTHVCAVQPHPYTSRSEQPPGIMFHPRDVSEKNHCNFFGPSWCNIKVDPER